MISESTLCFILFLGDWIAENPPSVMSTRLFTWYPPLYLQYQVTPTTATVEQNGETPAIKTTTIHIAPNTGLSTNTNSNNSNASDSASRCGLSASRVSYTAQVHPPVTRQNVREREKTKTWRDHTELQSEKSWTWIQNCCRQTQLRHIVVSVTYNSGRSKCIYGKVTDFYNPFWLALIVVQLLQSTLALIFYCIHFVLLRYYFVCHFFQYLCTELF